MSDAIGPPFISDRTGARGPTYGTVMEEPRTLVVIVRRWLRGEGKCRRCGHPVFIDEHTARAITFGAAMLCLECSHELHRAGEQFDPAEVLGDE